MTRIYATKGDITKINGMDAIVSAANSSLLCDGEEDEAIHRAAMPQLLEECRTLNGCDTGEAKITGAYNLPCKYVIHTVGPIWKEAGDEDELLCNAYYNSLSLAMENGIKKIAFPSISTGTYGFPLQRAARLAISTCARFAKEHPQAIDEIQFVLHDDRTYLVYDMEIEKLYD